MRLTQTTRNAILFFIVVVIGIVFAFGGCLPNCKNGAKHVFVPHRWIYLPLKSGRVIIILPHFIPDHYEEVCK